MRIAFGGEEGKDKRRGRAVNNTESSRDAWRSAAAGSRARSGWQLLRYRGKSWRKETPKIDVTYVTIVFGLHRHQSLVF